MLNICILEINFPHFISLFRCLCILYKIHICCLVFLLVLPRLSLIVLNKIIAAIYIFLYQDIQYRTNGITVHCSLSRLEPMQQYVMYSVLGWSGLTLFCDFNNLRCTHFCRSGIFYWFNSKKIGNFNRVQCASITYCTLCTTKVFIFKKSKGL